MLSASRAANHEHGAVAIVVALLLVVFMAAVAMAVDVGGLYLRRRELVNGADAAALSAARTCARFGVITDQFSSPEEAADHQVQLNAPITDDEVAGTNVVYRPPVCGSRYGRVSVEYTSQQSLYFAPVLGFNRTSPVTTTATASWGLGSNNPIPMMLTAAQSSTCPLPPQAGATVGQTVCAFWFDNDTVGPSNWTFLSLNPSGWDVTPGSNCPGSQSGGTQLLTSWVDGSVPVSVTLNWMDPTYVCNDTGIRGLGTHGATSILWKAVQALATEQAVRDFPINWMGPESPMSPAPAQGVVLKSDGSVDKYDIIGFARMKVIDVVQGTPSNLTASCSVTWTTSSPLTQSLQCFPDGSTFQGYSITPGNRFCTEPVIDATHLNCTISQLPSGNGTVAATVSYLKPSVCGPAPSSNAWCVVLQYQGSTLMGDYPTENRDSITVVRLCDLTYNTCLDRNHPSGN